MSAFYGNIKNNSRASFIFDRTYPNRKAMEDNMAQDKIFNGRYILVEYGEKRFTQYLNVNNKFYHTGTETTPIERPDPSVEYYTYNKNDKEYILIDVANVNFDNFINIIGNGGNIFEKQDHEFLDESCEYYENRHIDEVEYQDCYDSTVWQKIWTNVKDKDGNYIGQEKYIMVAELNAIAPTLDLIVDAPSDDADLQQPHFDKVFSTDLDYKFHVPMNWKIDPEVTFEYNARGFDPEFKSHTEPETGDASAAKWDNTIRPDSPEYPDHEELESTTVDGKKIRVGKYINGILQTSPQNDTKKLNLDLSDIGNLASDFWDLIYPLATAPFYKPVPTDINGAEDGYITNGAYTNFLPENLYILNYYGEYIPVTSDDEYNPNIKYYYLDEVDNGERDTRIGNRDGSISIPQSTVAELINNIFNIYGLPNDNEFRDILDLEPTTIYGLYNGFKDILGLPSDELDEAHFIPVSDDGWFTYGTTNESNFEYWHYSNYGPLYIIDNATDADNNVYNLFIPAGDSREEVQYYIDINTLWAQLKNFKDNREDNQSDWTEDLPDSISYIKHKPSVVFATESEINTAYLIEDLKLIEETFDAEEIPFDVNDMINPHSIDERWGEIVINKSNVSVIEDVYDQTGESLGATILTEADILEAIAEAEAE